MLEGEALKIYCIWAHDANKDAERHKLSYLVALLSKTRPEPGGQRNRGRM